MRLLPTPVNARGISRACQLLHRMVCTGKGADSIRRTCWRCHSLALHTDKMGIVWRCICEGKGSIELMRRKQKPAEFVFQIRHPSDAPKRFSTHPMCRRDCMPPAASRAVQQHICGIYTYTIINKGNLQHGTLLTGGTSAGTSIVATYEHRPWASCSSDGGPTHI